MNEHRNDIKIQKDMNKTDVNKKIVKVLKKMGYVPKIDEDNDVGFRYQLKWVYVLMSSDDEEEHPLICVSLTRIYEFDNDSKEEKTGALIISNDMTQEKALTKVTVDLKRGFVNAHAMMMYTSEKAMELHLEKILSRDEFGNVSSEFRRRITYLTE